MSNLQKPDGISDSEWRQILAQRRARDFEYQRLAKISSETEDGYARRRDDRNFDRVWGYDADRFLKHWGPIYWVILILCAIPLYLYVLPVLFR